jgi:peptidoglycan/LPS O-acetylase OafA/YrhL
LRTRSLTVDAFKAIAAQLIVLHHFAAYSPMADVLSMTWSGLINVLFEDARMVVQVFLVTSGYLVARSFARQEKISPLPLIVRRYFRLLPSYFIALVITVLAAWLMRSHIEGAAAALGLESWLPAEPSWVKFFGHLLMVQNVLQIDALTVGVWYVAIDLQLFMATVFLIWLANTLRGKYYLAGHLTLISLLSTASLWFFNLNPDWDDYAVYFYGAYGLGMLAFWSTQQPRALKVFVFTLAMAVGAFIYAPRARVAIAIATALSLYLATKLNPSGSLKARSKYLHLLSDSSYALFLNHFAVLIVLSGVWYKYALQSELSAWIFIALGWSISFVFSLLVYKYLERPLVTWLANALDRVWARKPLAALDPKTGSSASKY